MDEVITWKIELLIFFAEKFKWPYKQLSCVQYTRSSWLIIRVNSTAV